MGLPHFWAWCPIGLTEVKSLFSTVAVYLEVTLFTNFINSTCVSHVLMICMHTYIKAQWICSLFNDPFSTGCFSFLESNWKYATTLYTNITDNISGCEAAEKRDVLVNKMKNGRGENCLHLKSCVIIIRFWRLI
jgi:hypothetical protein